MDCGVAQMTVGFAFGSNLLSVFPSEAIGTAVPALLARFRTLTVPDSAFVVAGFAVGHVNVGFTPNSRYFVSDSFDG
jgi:hypothetical protein